MPDDTASAELRSGRLSVREWRALADRGVTTVDEPAGLDTPAEEFRAAYLPEVTHLTDPLGRLADAVRRARMLRAGVTLKRETRVVALHRLDQGGALVASVIVGRNALSA